MKKTLTPKSFDWNTIMDGVLDGYRLITIGVPGKIPARSTITGIQVDVRHSNKITNCMAHLRVGQGDASVSAGAVVPWTSVNARYVTYGGRQHLWGGTKSISNPAILNEGRLNFALLVSENVGREILRQVKMTVYYI